MKKLWIAAIAGLVGSSAANAGTILDIIRRSDARLKIEDCSFDICATIRWGKQRFVVKKSDISSLFRDLDKGGKLITEKPSTKQGDKRATISDRNKLTESELRARNWDGKPNRFDEPDSRFEGLLTRGEKSSAAAAAKEVDGQKVAGASPIIRDEDRAPPASRVDDTGNQVEARPGSRTEGVPSPTAGSKDANQQKVALAAPGVSYPDGPIGEWIVESGEGRVEIQPCGQEDLCGVVSSSKNPDATDRHNPDASRRNRPLIGVPVLIDMKPTKKGRWEGQAYNVKDGKTYAANIAMKNPNTLRLEGCAFGGLLCGSQDWIRAKDLPQ
jgi:uncharacterized protein (DUF2147 family)